MPTLFGTNALMHCTLW